ncbi:DNA polymerase III subunit beta [uncultured Thiodictyon sp.]|uniref:DNA polymerase III subunit beta n=1 Tax=uncultured Thiodictyon sp. TaxID=1846217 RepID=UPI0025EB47B4|nr:DNA polymerase III subunit beta [uncultured Thiodictyon sp.]
MDVKVNREEMLPVLNRVVSVVERRQTLPILGNILLRGQGESLTVIGTDMEIEIRAGCRAEVIESGEATVPARKLGDICRSLAEGSEMRLKIGGERCVLTAGRGRYVLGTLPARDFPVMESILPDVAFELEGGVLKRILEKTAFAMAQQDVRYYLNGLFFEVDGSCVKAVATDGHRLACYEHPCSLGVTESRSVIVPFKTVNELRRQLSSATTPVQIEIAERLIRFVVGDTVSSSKLVDGRYPEYSRVIPTGLTKVAIADRDSLRKALARTAILSNEKYRGLRVTFEPGVLRLVAHNPEQEEAVEEMEVDYAGAATIVGFNVAYLSDLLGAVDSDKVEVHFDDGNSSSLWRGLDAAGETYVVMPMRL